MWRKNVWIEAPFTETLQVLTEALQIPPQILTGAKKQIEKLENDPRSRMGVETGTYSG